MFVQSEIRLLLAIFPRLIYFSTRTMNLESDFKLRAVKLSREAVYIQVQAATSLKPLVVAICDKDYNMTTIC